MTTKKPIISEKVHRIIAVLIGLVSITGLLIAIRLIAVLIGKKE